MKPGFANETKLLQVCYTFMNVKLLVFFLIVNFAALGIGGLFTNSGVVSQWYLQMNKAPWTPPGWVFGAAWTFIMICFSFYMTHLFNTNYSRNLIITLFTVQWILNVSWNILFFKSHLTGLALIGIALLFFTTIIYLTLSLKQQQVGQIVLILPYVIWLSIAVSLNAYIVVKN